MKKAQEEAKKLSLERQKMIDDERKKLEDSARIALDAKEEERQAGYRNLAKMAADAREAEADIMMKAHLAQLAKKDEDAREAQANEERQQRETEANAIRFAEEQAKLLDTTRANADMARQLGMTFSSAFEDAAVRGRDLRTVIQGIGQDIARIILRKSITEPFAGAIGGAFSSGGGILGGLSNLFAGTSLDNAITNMRYGGGDFASARFAENVSMGFAGGGSFTVGGAGGTDSQFVGFRATPGERVSVQTPGQQSSRGGDSYFIDARGADTAAVARLERVILSVNGSIERRAVAAFGEARRRGAL